ncbi:FAD binding domain-containing protein [Paraclostridium ghonii]|uniref:FAD binding domain-containing protein n=1 Tax=Paraclostridium ghonii TaxID=29358 RepID=UPI00202CBE16|nr:FAD binding domain-containing protein [Paeniclostridium ghonii]MCM0166875.1 FAD binding domain-containing protein [Paeniclostridium ghonii]
MIPFDFEYYKPDNIKEAINIFKYLNYNNKEPIYYSGGTEIITSSTRGFIKPKSIIDIKGILECNELGIKNDDIVIGSCITLATIENTHFFQLLSNKAKGISDLTTRNKITVGGNICGNIKYKEAILPFLISDTYLTIASERGLKKVDLNSNFSNKLNLNQGEFIVNFILNKNYANLRSTYTRETKFAKIDYPLVSTAALSLNDKIRVAFSGICDFPFRSKQVEDKLNDSGVSKIERINNAISAIPYKIINDVQGSSEYRRFVLKNNLIDILNNLGVE